MLQDVVKTGPRSLRLDQTDLEIQAVVGSTAVTIEVMKSGACVHRLVIDDATSPIEHGWLMDLFAREDHIDLGAMMRDADDYVAGLDINQG